MTRYHHNIPLVLPDRNYQLYEVWLDALLLYAIIGFVCQMIDGSLGMGYKATSSTLLLSAGLPPVVASAATHTAGIFTSAASGYAHYRLGNLNKRLLFRLSVAGILGGVLGALMLSRIPTDVVKPVVAIYLAALGSLILYRAWGSDTLTWRRTSTPVLGTVGGFLDSIGGGGWGPVVTGTLVVNGNNPRKIIGTVSIAEFFVTLAQAATFATVVHTMEWTPVLGLIIGGVPAAPFAAWLCKHIPVRRLMGLVGGLIVILSVRTLILAFGA